MSPAASTPLSTHPLDAFALDAEARSNAISSDRTDPGWLALATMLHRLSTLTRQARDRYLAALDDESRARDHAPVSSPGPDLEPLPASMIRLVVRLASRHAPDPAEQAASDLQYIVEGMENHQAFHLAFATLAAARSAALDLSPLHAGRLTAQQARVARQLGDLETAEDLYGLTMDLGVRNEEPELLARAHVGYGLVAETRGNYPAARHQYWLALEHGSTAPRVAAIAHHGLMVAASKAGDLDTAFHHAWAAFEGVAGDPVRRVDLLINLAELARRSGEPAVALRAFRQALAHAELARLRLPALSGAAQSAAALGDVQSVAALAAQADREAPASGIPYESSRVWLALARAFAALGDPARAAAYAQRAESLAATHSFHEVDVQADELARVIAELSGERAASRRADPATRDILGRLDALADASRAALVG